MPTQDKRRDLRKPARAYALLKFASGAAESVVGCITNISRGGAQVNVQVGMGLPTVGTRVELVAEGIQASGEVRALANPPHSQRLTGKNISIRFDSPLSRHDVEKTWRHTLVLPVRSILPLKFSGEELIQVVLATFGRSHPLANIVYRVANAGCNLVTVEFGYEGSDGDLPPDGFAAGHYRSSDLPCRLHFWVVPSSVDEDGANVEYEKGGMHGHGWRYLGFVVLRPLKLSFGNLKLGHVGRTLLAYPEGGASGGTGNDCFGKIAPSTTKAAFSGGLGYYLLSQPRRVVVYGYLQSVFCTEYQQQSLVGGTCGHTAVLVTSMYLARTWGSRALSSHDVQELVRTGTHSGAATGNLREHQIAKALSATGGLVRHYHSSGTDSPPSLDASRRLAPDDLADLIHVGVDSKLPVILIMRGAGGRTRHAVVAVGHTYLLNGGPFGPVQGAASGPSVRTSTQWVPHFLVHDDAIGPYLRLALRKDHAIPAPNAEDTSSQFDAIWHNKSCEADVEGAFLALPPRVRLCPVDALATVVAFLNPTQIDRLIEDENQSSFDDSDKWQYFREFRKAAANEEVVLSPYLDLSNRFRVATVALAQANSTGFSEEAELISRLLLPEYVYIVGISTVDRLNADGLHKADRIGYVIIDATATPFADDRILFARIGELTVIAPMSEAPVIWNLKFHPRRHTIGGDT